MFLLTLVEHRFRDFAVKKLSRSMAQLLVRASELCVRMCVCVCACAGACACACTRAALPA